jgi:NAD(P)-dependent dehydrogenase (short-subunit alcohol dehydrogenase family)
VHPGGLPAHPPAGVIGQTVAAFGRLDFAFNNAGIFGETPDLTEQAEEEFDRVTSVNVKGVWLGMKKARHGTLAAGGRRFFRPIEKDQQCVKLLMAGEKTRSIKGSHAERIANAPPRHRGVGLRDQLSPVLT